MLSIIVTKLYCTLEILKSKSKNTFNISSEYGIWNISEKIVNEIENCNPIEFMDL